MPHLPLTPENGQEVLPAWFNMAAFLIGFGTIAITMLYLVISEDKTKTTKQIIGRIVGITFLILVLIVVTVLILKTFLI